MLMFPLDMEMLAEAFRQDSNAFGQFCVAMVPVIAQDAFRSELMAECDHNADIENAIDVLSTELVNVYNRGR